MIITLEHEDVEAALLAWMNEKGMAANAATTSIDITKTNKTGRITAIMNPNGKVAPKEEVAEETVAAPAANIFQK